MGDNTDLISSVNLNLKGTKENTYTIKRYFTSKARATQVGGILSRLAGI